MDAQDEARQERLDRLNEQRDRAFEAAAVNAANLAATAAYSAELHQQMDTLPGAKDHAERDRRLAGGERAAAAAYRRHELPSDAVRRSVRDLEDGQAAEQVAREDREPGSV